MYQSGEIVIGTAIRIRIMRLTFSELTAETLASPLHDVSVLRADVGVCCDSRANNALCIVVGVRHGGAVVTHTSLVPHLNIHSGVTRCELVATQDSTGCLSLGLNGWVLAAVHCRSSIGALSRKVRVWCKSFLDNLGTISGQSL